MTITVQQFISRPEMHGFENAVSVSGLTVSVAAGAFKIGGTDYSIDAQQDFVCTPDVTDVVHVRGYIAHDAQSGDEILVVDEFRDQDSIFKFEEDPDLTLLHRLFSFDMAANETDLANSAIEVHHIVAPSGTGYEAEQGFTQQQSDDRAANIAQLQADVAAEKALYDAWVAVDAMADPVGKKTAYDAWQAHINP